MPRQDLESDATFPALNSAEGPVETSPPTPAQTLAEAAMRIRARRNEIHPGMIEARGPGAPQPAIDKEGTVLNHLSNVERELDRYIRVQAVQNNNISASVQNIARTNLIILDKLDRHFPRPPSQ